MRQVPPQLLAAADQELAGVDGALDALVREYQNFNWAKGDDRVFRVSEFICEMLPDLTLNGAAALLTVAIERLAENK